MEHRKAFDDHPTQRPDRSTSPGRSRVAMPPSTPPRDLLPSRLQELQSTTRSTTTIGASPGYSSDTTSPTSTAPTSATSSPITPCPAPGSKWCELDGNKHSSPTTKVHTRSARVKFDLDVPRSPTSSKQHHPTSCSNTSNTVTSAQSPDAGVRTPQDTAVGSPSHASLGSPSFPPTVSDTPFPSLRLITPRTRFYVHTPSRPFAFPTPPSLSPSAKTTFGPFPSPHTLADLHALAYTNRVAIPIEPCLQCQLKNLPCPTTTNSPAHAGFGPVVTAGGATLPRPRTTHPRFPACLRCIRAGEADACIAQRRATPAERAAIADAGSSQAQQLQLELGTVLLPTDRDVLSPELWERKMVRREELLAAAAKREAKAGLAPKRVEGWRSGREEVRKGQERDRVLLSGRGREAVLLPHERWGCRWVGKREREEWEFVEMAVRKIEADEEAMKSGGVGLGVGI